MKAEELTTLIAGGLRLGLTAVEIARDLCNEHGGYRLPTLEEFDQRTEDLRHLADLTPAGTQER